MFKKLLITIILVFLAVGMTSAQTPLARFDAPTNGAIEVSLTPTIRLYTKYKVDSASIPFNRTDSLEKPLLIIPKFIYDSIPQYMYDSSTASYYNVWNNFGKRGTYSNPNDTTLEFTFISLKMGETYIVIVNNVHVITPGPFVVQVPDSIITIFTTVLPPHNIYFNSLLHVKNFLRCSDTIQIRYNRQLDSVNTPSGKLIEFYHLTVNPADTTEDTTNATPHYLRDTLSISSWVAGTDSSMIKAVLTGLTPGDYYEMAYFTSRLTGDSTQNENFIFRLRDRFELTVDAVASDTNDTLPSIPGHLLRTGTFHVLHGDSVYFQPPSKIGNFSFWKWSCATDTSINNKTTSPLLITKTACNLKDVAITALYQRTHIDTLTVHTDSGGTAIIQNSSYTTLTQSTNYLVTRGDFVILTPYPDSGKVFHHWHCSIFPWNGSTTPILKVPIGSDVLFTPVFTNATPNANFQLCGIVNVIDLPQGVNPATIAVIVSPDPPPCFTDLGATSHDVIMQILDPDYGLRKYTIGLGMGITSSVPNPATNVQSLDPTFTKTVTEVSASPVPKVVTFYVEKLEVQLHVEIALEDGSEPIDDGLLVFDAFGGVYKNPPPYQYWVDVYSNPRGGIKPIVEDPWVVTTKPRDRWTLTYKAGQDVTLYARNRPGYEFVGWSTETGYTSPNPGVLPINNFSFTIHYPASPVKVKALYKELFRIDRITLVQDLNFTNIFTENTYTTDPMRGTYGIGVQKEVGFTSGDVVVKMDFSKAVNPLTLYKIVCTQNWKRIDGKGLSEISPGAWAQNYTLSNGDKTLTWIIAQPTVPYRLVKLQEFVMSVTNGLKSALGEPLSNPRDFVAQTINPNNAWYVDKINVHFGNDFCAWCDSDVEPVLVPVTTYFKEKSEHDVCPIGADPDNDDLCVISFRMEDTNSSGEFNSVLGTKAYNYHIFSKIRIRSNSVVIPLVSVEDHDEGEWLFVWLAVAVLIAVVAFGTHIAGVEVLALTGAALGWFNAAKLIAAVGASLAVLMSAEDDHIGTVEWIGNRENWWGAHPSYKNELTKKCSGDGADVDVTVKVIVQ